MRVLIALCLILCCGFLNAQSTETLSLLSDHLGVSNDKSEAKGIQIHQFLDTCIYDHVCGKFTGGSIKEFGLIKGVAITIDRRLRCTQLARSQFLAVRINEQGKVMDHWKDYRIDTE